MKRNKSKKSQQTRTPSRSSGSRTSTPKVNEFKRRMARERNLRRFGQDSAKELKDDRYGRKDIKAKPAAADGKMRLQKFISQCGIASRRAAEELIIEGKVKVNGRIISELGKSIDPRVDRVQVRNKFLQAPERGILLFNKPKGVVSTLSDPEGRPCIADYLTKHYQSYFPVGRLDWDSTGLMVLTNDGELAERLMHPRYEFPRIYQARIEGSISESTIAKMRRGVTLADGPARGDAKILMNDKDATWVEVSVKEGRNRLVRRLMDKVGHPVMKLKRVLYGPFTLGKIKPGELRKLTQAEYEKIRFKVIGE